MLTHIPPHITPDRGFCDAVCNRKINNYFLLIQTIIKIGLKIVWYKLNGNSESTTLYIRILLYLCNQKSKLSNYGTAN